MTVEEKFDNAKDKIAGKAKEVEGKVTGDKQRELQGKTQNIFGKAKDAVTDIKDAAEEAVKDTIDDYKQDSKKILINKYMKKRATDCKKKIRCFFYKLLSV
ncbi:CsbD family protein [Leuconostoc sp. DB-1]|nr:CsbD family protein [Leuconostoc sp. DB-1]